jgi:hypothetical protein
MVEAGQGGAQETVVSCCVTMRPFLMTACFVAAAACHAASAPAPSPVPPAPANGDDGLLPSSLCFRPGYLSRVEGCKQRSHVAALVFGVYPTPELASRALRTVPRTALPPGYPLAAHVDELGLSGADKGIAIVAALFSDDAHAQAWADAHAGTLPGVTVAKLRPTTDAHPFVIRIQAGGASAYDRGPIDRLLHKSSLSYDEMRGAVPEKDLKVVCKLPSDTLFLASGSDVSFRFHWAPVHCGDTAAYVRWTDTLVDTVILWAPDRTTTLVQVVDVSCDVAVLGRWRYDERGRQPLPPLAEPAGGCSEDDDGP